MAKITTKALCEFEAHRGFEDSVCSPGAFDPREDGGGEAAYERGFVAGLVLGFFGALHDDCRDDAPYVAYNSYAIAGIE